MTRREKPNKPTVPADRAAGAAPAAKPGCATDKPSTRNGAHDTVKKAAGVVSPGVSVTRRLTADGVQSPPASGNRAVKGRARRFTNGKKYSVDLPALMAECDANYLRLQKLFPAIHDQDSHRFGVDINGLKLAITLRVLERGPYTTLLCLTQEPAPPWSRKPSLTIRLYHDARSAEVVEYQGKRHFRAVYDYPNEDMRQPDEKAQINRFLSEYLSLCLAHGVAEDGSVLAR